MNKNSNMRNSFSSVNSQNLNNDFNFNLNISNVNYNQRNSIGSFQLNSPNNKNENIQYDYNNAYNCIENYNAQFNPNLDYSVVNNNANNNYYNNYDYNNNYNNFNNNFENANIQNSPNPNSNQINNINNSYINNHNNLNNKENEYSKAPESLLDEFIPEDLKEFFQVTEEWADTYIISKNRKINFIQSAGTIYVSNGLQVKVEEDSFNFDKNFKKEEVYNFEFNLKQVKLNMFDELLNVVYNEEKIEKNFFTKYKSVSDYLYKKGLILLKKNFFLIKYNLPFIILREENEEKDIVVIKLKNSETNEEYVMIIAYFPVITFPCVVHYLKEFLKLYNSKLFVDDIYNRYTYKNDT